MIKIQKISIVDLDTDAIVNAANEDLRAGGGVCGAIFKAAGYDQLQKACNTIGYCNTGSAVITPGFDLKAKYIIHAVGPIWHGGSHKEPELLYSAYYNSLKLAKEYNCHSIGFPLISSGIFGYPKEAAWHTALQACSDFLNQGEDESLTVIFAVRDEAILEMGQKMLADSVIQQTSEKHIPSMIGFFLDNEEYGCFSNWYHAEFDYAGRHYHNVEQYMMFQKVMMFQQYDLAEKIMQTKDPAKCKKLGRTKFPEFNGDVWDKTCYTIVKRGVKAKFTQNPRIQKILLSTGNSLLAECSPSDKKWGIGIDINDPKKEDISKWNGQNLLGRILMEVREELGRELQFLPNGDLQYIEARDLSPIAEWNMSAGELKRIPQYYSAIHAYSDTLSTRFGERDIFYNDYSLFDWEIAMNTNMGGGLPIAGFFEMKQEVYDIARNMKLLASENARKLAFCYKFIPFLQMVSDDVDLVEACRQYSAYSVPKRNPSLIAYLNHVFLHEAYNSGIVVTNYSDLVKDQGIERWVAEPTDEKLEGLDADHVAGCIAWHFRRDHFSEGSLISESIAEGYMLKMMKAYVTQSGRL